LTGSTSFIQKTFGQQTFGPQYNEDLKSYKQLVKAASGKTLSRRNVFRPNDVVQILDGLRVCLLAEEVSAPRSFPAKSINENFPYNDFLAPWRRIIWKTACDLKFGKMLLKPSGS
jgi:hypothetical protein